MTLQEPAIFLNQVALTDMGRRCRPTVRWGGEGSVRVAGVQLLRSSLEITRAWPKPPGFMAGTPSRTGLVDLEGNEATRPL